MKLTILLIVAVLATCDAKSAANEEVLTNVLDVLHRFGRDVPSPPRSPGQERNPPGPVGDRTPPGPVGDRTPPGPMGDRTTPNMQQFTKPQIPDLNEITLPPAIPSKAESSSTNTDEANRISDNIRNNFDCSQNDLMKISQKVSITCGAKFVGFSNPVRKMLRDNDNPTPEQILAAVDWNSFCESSFQQCVDEALALLPGTCFNALQVAVLTNGACALEEAMCASNGQALCGYALFGPGKLDTTADDFTPQNCQVLKDAGCCSGQLEYLATQLDDTVDGLSNDAKGACSDLGVSGIDSTPCDSSSFDECHLKKLAAEAVALGNGEVDIPTDSEGSSGGSDSGGGMPTWGIALAVVGAALVVGVIVVALFIAYSRRNSAVRYHIQADAFDDDDDDF